MRMRDNKKDKRLLILGVRLFCKSLSKARFRKRGLQGWWQVQSVDCRKSELKSEMSIGESKTEQHHLVVRVGTTGDI